MECVKSCIYGIKYEGKIVYVGRHNTPNHVERWKQHVKQSKRNASSLLHKKMVEYGVERFSIEKICECDAEDVGDTEIRYIQEYNTLIPNGYNMQKCGLGKGRHSEETKKKMSLIDRSKEKNSQFGTCWITNGIDSVKIKKGDLIPEGWKLGRKMKKDKK